MDAADPKIISTVEKIFQEGTGKGFDIVIDDGSHLQYDMMVSR